MGVAGHDTKSNRDLKSSHSPKVNLSSAEERLAVSESRPNYSYNAHDQFLIDPRTFFSNTFNEPLILRVFRRTAENVVH
jgi:hypothetical protein